MTNDEMVGERVHALMWRARMTQRELGAQLGLAQTSLSSKLRGRRPWSVDELVKVAGVLGVRPGELIDPDEDVLPGVVRRQGLEPRTRWFGAAEASLDGVDAA